jgi:spermidine synthase
MRLNSVLLYIAFLFSGLASLLFQVVMNRQFGLIFGAGLISSAAVIGIFLLGLGVGSYFGGRLAYRFSGSRSGKLIPSYIAIELILALLTAVTIISFSKFEFLSAALSGYEIKENGWNFLNSFSVLGRIAVGFAAVFPQSCLMGVGFPLLSGFDRHRNSQKVSDTFSYLYAFNTFGGALGCILADTLFIPELGLIGSQKIISGSYILASALVYISFWISKPKEASEAAKPAGIIESSLENGAGRIRNLLLMVFLSGFISIALEMIWLRFTSGFVGQRRISFSMLLFIFLFFVQLGSFAAPPLMRKFRNSLSLFFSAQALSLFASVVCMLCYSDQFFNPQTAVFEGQLALVASLKIVALPSFFAGISFPVLSKLVLSRHDVLDKRTGLIFLLNSVGAFAGSLGTAYLLIPFLGIQKALVFLLVLLTGGCFLVAVKNKTVWAIAALSVVLSVLVLSDSREHFLRLEDRLAKMTGVLPLPQNIAEIIEGEQDTVAAVYSGDDEQRRSILSNGFVMSGNQRTVRRNMRSAVHLPMLMQKAPVSALTICYGIGNAAAAILLHPSVKSLEIVDISKDILELSPHFESSNHGVLEDSRTHVYVNDGRQHLRMQPAEIYDFVTMDPPPLYFAGIDSLYDIEFDRLVYRSLKPGGIMSLWLPMWHLDKKRNLAVIHTFTSVFDDVHMIETGFGNYVLVGRKGEKLKLTRAEFKMRLEERPDVASDLAQLNLNSVPQFFGQFVAADSQLRSSAKDAEILTDMNPSLEYTGHEVLNSEVPVEVFAESQIGEWCADCLAPKSKEVKLLSEYIKYLASVRRHPSYKHSGTGSVRHSELKGLSTGLTEEEEQTLFSLYPELKEIDSSRVK